MSDYEDYCALIKLLNTDDTSRHSRRKHRLPVECYSLSDCEYFFTLCARHQGTPFTEPELAVAVVESLLWRKERHHWRLYTLCLMPDHLRVIRYDQSIQQAASYILNNPVRKGIVKQWQEYAYSRIVDRW